MPKVFDYLNYIYTRKDDNLRIIADEKDYVPFLINKAVSYHIDCVLQANQANMLSHLTKSQQYDYYISSIKPRKRYAKSHKPAVEEDLLLIQEYYGYNAQKARICLRILNHDQLQNIRDKSNKGGIE